MPFLIALWTLEVYMELGLLFRFFEVVSTVNSLNFCYKKTAATPDPYRFF
jgi:hypothetical protein